MSHPWLVIEVAGGVVQGVYSSSPRLQVLLVDWDCDDAASPAAVAVDSHGSSRSAFVERVPLEPWPTSAEAEIVQVVRQAELEFSAGAPQDDPAACSPRELATLLAALRFWQDELRRHGPDLTTSDPHFDDYLPLTEAEIDELCQRLNGG